MIQIILYLIVYLKDTDNYEHLSVAERTILKWIVKKYGGRVEIGFISPTMATSENSDETPGSTKGNIFLDQLSELLAS
jgi:hypothetical protein